MMLQPMSTGALSPLFYSLKFYTDMQLEPARRSNVHMRVAVHGPSGAGKSYSALQLAFGLSKEHIAIIDTEAVSASL